MPAFLKQSPLIKWHAHLLDALGREQDFPSFVGRMNRFINDWGYCKKQQVYMQELPR
jgi:hypothetical protein